MFYDGMHKPAHFTFYGLHETKKFTANTRLDTAYYEVIPNGTTEPKDPTADPKVLFANYDFDWSSKFYASNIYPTGLQMDEYSDDSEESSSEEKQQ